MSGRPTADAAPVAVFEGWEDYGDRLRPLITVIGELRAGDVLYVRQPSPEVRPAQWDADATQRLRSIVAALGMESIVPDGDLTGYEFTVLGMVRMEIERLKAATVQPAAAPSQAAVVYPPDGTVSPFTVINLGSGMVKMGDAVHDGRLPALWFGKDGLGMGVEEVLNRVADNGETLAVVTFANAEALDVLLEVVQRIRTVAFPDAPSPAAQQNAMEVAAYPATLTPELEHALGFMNFRTGPIAHLFRAAGAEIPRKCEAEQAFVLDRMIRAVIKHGDQWADAFFDEMKAAQAKLGDATAKQEGM